MSGKDDPKNSSLVPSGNRDLVARSSALVRRGLQSLSVDTARIIRFPPDRSMGKLYIHDQEDESSESELELGEACGNITVPAGKDLFLRVNGAALTDLSPLAALQPNDLQELELLDTGKSFDSLTDAELVNIMGLTGLKGLRLCGFKISDAGLTYLRGLTKLQWLILLSTGITDAGLIHLRGLTELRLLNLIFTHITGLGLVHLQGLAKLRSLCLLHAKMDDGGLTNLQGMTALEELNLAYTSVTDAGLEHLRQLTALKELSLRGTQVSDAGLAGLERALPNCDIQ